MEEAPHRGLVRPVRIDPTGADGPTRGQARGPRWRQTSHGFYVPAAVDAANVDQRILEASVVVPTGCAITGWAALRWLGGVWFTGGGARTKPVTILVGTQDIRPQPGIQPCGEGVSRHDIVVVDGIPVTVPAWSVVHSMRRSTDRREAVAALDMAAYSDLVSLAEASEVIGRQSGWTGVPQARWARDHGAENSWSPAETRMGLVWELDGGHPPPLHNQPLFDRTGRHIGTPDLVDPVAGVVGEYDGAHHLEPDQRVTDVNRDAAFRAHGLEAVTWLAGDPQGSFLRRLDAAYRRAGATGAQRRTWTIVPPAWWTSTATVEQRRALSAAERARFLRYRAA
ncbi:hypothetical protein KUV85_16520 [Nocardioides panacisoli]|uniref:hypothetical protein n=1 Tax=Nocardioides panacisoli TaxID=627624 RepID=UPI001C637624|nr:hypothetical protein [Nocardioides panacisoli]QYJ03904.1 hypothetical protein KUV85_16520 [Nocardioides panacisoli]